MAVGIFSFRIMFAVYINRATAVSLSESCVELSLFDDWILLHIELYFIFLVTDCRLDNRWMLLIGEFFGCHLNIKN